MEHFRRMRSVEASRVIWQTKEKLSGSELLVLHALANHVDEHFECYPSLGRLATMTKLSKRQVIRILRGLREKGHVAFEENRGGRQKCNHYRLLIVANGDTKSDTNCDIANGDTPKNGDSSRTETVTSCVETVTDSDEKGDAAMSHEGFEGKRREKSESEPGSPRPLQNRLNNPNPIPSLTEPLQNYEEAYAAVDECRIEALIEKITREGASITRTFECADHGPFLRPGLRLGDWILWGGASEIYGGGFSGASGCAGCEEKGRDFPDILNRFELEKAVFCEIHGETVLRAKVWENAEERAAILRERFTVSADDCPGCDSAWTERLYLQDDLGLSDEEWDRGGERILEALNFARGV